MSLLTYLLKEFYPLCSTQTSKFVHHKRINHKTITCAQKQTVKQFHIQHIFTSTALLSLCGRKQSLSLCISLSKTRSNAAHQVVHSTFLLCTERGRVKESVCLSVLALSVYTERHNHTSIHTDRQSDLCKRYLLRNHCCAMKVTVLTFPVVQTNNQETLTHE